jgi:hypothetical protein
MIKRWFYLFILENMHEKPLGLDCIDGNQTQFFFFEMKVYF